MKNIKIGLSSIYNSHHFEAELFNGDSEFSFPRESGADNACRRAAQSLRDMAEKFDMIAKVEEGANPILLGIAAPADDDEAILDAIKLNNQTQSRSDLKRIGLERGYQKTVNDFAKGISDAFGTGIARSAGYLEG